MKVKVDVDTLEGDLLDTAVAFALGWSLFPKDHPERALYWLYDPLLAPKGIKQLKSSFNPSSNPRLEYWVTCYPRSDEEPRVESELVEGTDVALWHASLPGVSALGATRSQARLRCYVKSKLGKYPVLDLGDQTMTPYCT